jgi:uncharacterized protein (DUF433 family)/DNA-binding transcriptional MerR regulator
MESMGAYTADRAAALSGVPRSTVLQWARLRLLVPSVSASGVKRWSFTDLIALRAVYWLRRLRGPNLGVDILASAIGGVRQALESPPASSATLRRDRRLTILLDGEGSVYVDMSGRTESITEQIAASKLLDLTAPFPTTEGSHGPDLQRPRMDLRIAPGKLSGSPHVVGTRLETRALAALGRDGYGVGAIAALYPYVALSQITQALELEEQLRKNLSARAAA